MRFSILLIAVVLFFTSSKTQAQGCVAIRGTGAICTLTDHSPMGETIEKAGQWQLTTGFRHFKSFRHFRGTHEEPERVENGTEVINWQNILDINLLYQPNARWAFAIGLPIVSNRRSSLYEHGRTSRHQTESFGISDMRIMAYAWLLDGNKPRKGNLQLGAGLKLPTGDYNYQDYFYNVGQNKEAELRPVDQSIQPGDGGTGLIVELNGYHNFSRNIGVYGNAFYMANPRDVNGTLTYRSNKYEKVMSVTDQYLVRGGVNYGFGGKKSRWSASAGMRYEGIPVNDLIGESNGFRRPGYVWSVEPGVNLALKNTIVSLTVPVAVARNRTQSNSDKLTTEETGVYRHGDAAFADYTINIGASFRF